MTYARATGKMVWPDGYALPPDNDAISFGRTTWAVTSAIGCTEFSLGTADGTGLLFTTRPSTEAGSIQAEIEISLFSRQCLGQRRIPSFRNLRREARAWNRRINRQRATINWRFTPRKACTKFGYKRNQITRSET
jgi:hypothetical protein